MVERPEENGTSYSSETSLQKVLLDLGDTPPKHLMNYTDEQVKQGEEIVKLGKTTTSDGGKTNYVSKHYVCTSCHNLEQEDPDLRFSNPETRLPYVKEKGIPFLQGSTFKGIVNRESWYNDDYVKKYGDEKIEIAHEDLRESIQLCAIECSQGRPMDNWEIDAVLAYYWNLQFDLGDLELSEADLAKLNREKEEEGKQEELVKWMKSFYLQKSPAHFYDAAPNKQEGYPGLIGNPDVGKDIYELSCLYCHKAGGVSHYILDNNTLSFKDINRTLFKDSHFSLYQIIPYGTYAIPGHRPYMPHYPLERMSKQQVEDLRSYVELKSS
ncbi:MAG: cytochrome c [Saprospiraceae bacterium]|jgi:cytochrome c